MTFKQHLLSIKVEIGHVFKHFFYCLYEHRAWSLTTLAVIIDVVKMNENVILVQSNCTKLSFWIFKCYKVLLCTFVCSLGKWFWYLLLKVKVHFCDINKISKCYIFLGLTCAIDCRCHSIKRQNTQLHKQYKVKNVLILGNLLIPYII